MTDTGFKGWSKTLEIKSVSFKVRVIGPLEKLSKG